MSAVVYALVDARLEPLPGTVLCGDHFVAEHTRQIAIAAAATGQIGWRPQGEGGGLRCVVCERIVSSGRSPARLEEWLRQTKTVDVVAVDGGASWEVWVGNGREEPFFEGVPLASCDVELHAELVAEGLRALKDERS